MNDEGTPALREPRHRVSPKARWVWAAEAAWKAFVAGAVIAGAGRIFDLHWPWWVWALYAVGAVGYLVTMPLVRFRIHRWETTETAVYTQSGWLSRDRRVAPMSRVQTVDFHQGPLSRLLHLAAVTVTTASAAGPVRLSGLDRGVAVALVDDLTRRAEADSGDAT